MLADKMKEPLSFFIQLVEVTVAEREWDTHTHTHTQESKYCGELNDSIQMQPGMTIIT